MVLAAGLGWAGGSLQGALIEADLERCPAVRAQDPHSPSERVEINGVAVVRVTGWPRQAGQRWRVPAVVANWRSPGQQNVLPDPRSGDGVILSGEGLAPGLGDLLAGPLRISAVPRAGYEDGFDQAAFLAGRGIRWRAVATDTLVVVAADDPISSCGSKFLSPLRRVCSGRLQAGFPAREASLFESVLLGSRLRDDGVPRAEFGALGLSHLFAVSGLHVGIVAGIFLLALKPVGLGPVGRWVLVSLGLGVYVLLTGAAASTVRAACMASGALAAPVWGRRHALPRLLALIFWGTQVWSPASVSDTGLRLSFLAVAGIMLAGIRPWKPPRAWARWLVAGLSVSLGAQCLTAPEVARSFGWLSPWAPLVNLVAVPLFGLGVWCAVGGVALSWVPWVGDGLCSWSWLLLRSMEAAASALAHTLAAPPGLMPWGALRWLGWLVVLSGWCLNRGPRRIGLAVLLTLWPFLPNSGDGSMMVLQADVGQGDAAAFLFPDGSALLVDTGECWEGGGAPAVRDLLPWLRRRGVRGLAGIVLTHAHSDHDGAASRIAAAIPVARWWLGGSCRAPAGTPDTFIARPSTGDTLHAVGTWALVCLDNGDSEVAEHENDRSLALGLFRNGRLAGLWTGDLEHEGEQRLLAALPEGFPEPGAIFKAGHHGSRTSSGQELLDRVRPRLILISCGLASRHGHPSHGPFLAGGEPIPSLRTDLLGSLMVLWPESGPPVVRAARNSDTAAAPP